MIYLIRHAQSIANINGRAASHASIDLTDYGHQQAESLAKQLPIADRIFISPFIRTLQTAQPIVQRDGVQPEVLEIQEFSYLSDARCQNTTLEERKPFVDAYWAQANPDYKDAEDAESFAEFYQRVMDFSGILSGLRDHYQVKNLMVFSHGQFLTLFKLIVFEHRALSTDLMHKFRDQMIHHSIKNAEFFIYS
ncbi:histidine phosphatase family protein [Acinetobacter ursingii]|uniref:histidine phosphatase family protein n=1 Tax=Acinetobacter ursingii TaxID=108980 RepID=UPI0021CD944A|nr:histidine phosphatase family protein [Acinetobacter ursingii]MCU4483089.1 histidine phosphatase family protein [Acinetobacter ursingii]MCU4507411.1 histidine phosphatase family protein [Acinetobacter ursingii]